jgi:hypothetical protein
MAQEYPAIDLNNENTPDLAELAEEVYRTNRPAVIRRGPEAIAVLSPMRKAAQRHPARGAPVSGIPHYTLEQVFGSVPTPPHLQGKDIDEMIREAKEERAARLMQTLRSPDALS